MANAANQFCESEASNSHPKWKLADAIKWKSFLIVGKFAKLKHRQKNFLLFKYKDSWVLYNKARIIAAAKASKIPVDLLAGVAWIEAGGMPDFIDGIAHDVRSYDWSGPEFVDKYLTVTHHPLRTSVGSISIQLGNVFKLLGIKPDDVTTKQRNEMIKCLETDVFNVNIVAKFLYKLIKHDYPKANTLKLTDDQMIVVASRYNRGTQRKLVDYVASIKARKGEVIRKYSEYGRSLLRRRERIQKIFLNN